MFGGLGFGFKVVRFFFFVGGGGCRIMELWRASNHLLTQLGRVVGLGVEGVFCR